MLKNGYKQSVLSIVLVLSREGGFKFLNRLGKDCGLIQVVPVPRSPWEEAVVFCCCVYTVYFAKSNFKSSASCFLQTTLQFWGSCSL